MKLNDSHQMCKYQNMRSYVFYRSKCEPCKIVCLILLYYLKLAKHSAKHC